MTYKWPWYYHATVKKRDSQDAWMLKLAHANLLGNLTLGVSHAYISQINIQAHNARFTPVFDSYINFSQTDFLWHLMEQLLVK